MAATFTRLQFDVTCLACAGPLELVNPGGVWGEREAVVVVRCPACDVEFYVSTVMRRLHGDLTAPAGSQRPTSLVADLARVAHGYHQAGASISAACSEVGIDRHSYYTHTRKAAAR